MAPLPSRARRCSASPTGSPNRPRGMTRRRPAAQRRDRASRRSTAPSQLSWEGVWENAIAQAAEPMSRSLVMLFLNGGNDGVNCFVPTVGGVPSPAYVAARGAAGRDIARVAGPNAGGKIGSAVLANSADLAFANPLLSTAAGGDNGDARRASTSSGAPATGVRERISRSSRRPTTSRRTSRTSRAATSTSRVRSRSSRPAGSGAGSTSTARRSTRCRRSRSTRACRR